MQCKWSEAQYCVHVLVHLNIATMLEFSTQYSHGCLTVKLECHRLVQYRRARNSSLVDQLPLLPKLWQGLSRLLGCMQVTVEVHTLDIEATTASGRDKIAF